MKALAIAVLLCALLLCVTGCEQRINSDGKPWLADREEFRPAPTDPDATLMPDLQAVADEHPLAGMSR